jgi:MFS family permease
MRAARFFGALSILGVGAVHLQQYIGNGYSTVPTIGTMFLLNAISAGVVGFALLLPLNRLLGRRRGNAAIGVLALAGVGIAVGSLIALFISESGTLFGFAEHDYRTVIKIAIAVEALAAVLLTPLAAVSVRRALAERNGPRPRRPAGYAASRSA